MQGRRDGGAIVEAAWEGRARFDRPNADHQRHALVAKAGGIPTAAGCRKSRQKILKNQAILSWQHRPWRC